MENKTKKNGELFTKCQRRRVSALCSCDREHKRIYRACHCYRLYFWPCLFGAANAYLAMKIGMTICASIPAAVIAHGSTEVLKNGTVLENNIIQTVGSSGEALAAGVAFTLPALLLDESGHQNRYDFAISALGGLLGCLQGWCLCASS